MNPIFFQPWPLQDSEVHVGIDSWVHHCLQAWDSEASAGLLSCLPLPDPSSGTVVPGEIIFPLDTLYASVSATQIKHWYRMVSAVRQLVLQG